MPSIRMRQRPIADRRPAHRGRSRGQSLVEFALVLPVLLVFLAAAIDLGRIFYASISLTNAAREGAMQAAKTPSSFQANQPCNTSTNLVVCRVLLEAEDSMVTIASSDISLTCSLTGCPAQAGSTVKVSVRGTFQLITPLLSTVFGGQTIQFASNATAQVEYLPPAPVPTAGVGPVAQFLGNPTSGTASFTVTFTDASIGSPTGWLWDFGDGGQSSSQNPTHEYQAAGTYTVTLTVVNGVGTDSEVKTGYITALAASTPTPGPTPTPTPGPTPTPTPTPTPICVFPPNVIDMTPSQADAAIAAVGSPPLVPQGRNELTTGQKNKVQAQNPDHTECVAAGSTIEYWYRPNS